MSQHDAVEAKKSAKLTALASNKDATEVIFGVYSIGGCSYRIEWSGGKATYAFLTKEELQQKILEHVYNIKL